MEKEMRYKEEDRMYVASGKVGTSREGRDLGDQTVCAM